MPRAETLTSVLPVGFAADELAAGARWVAARIRPAASTRSIAAALEALQAVAHRARRGPVCIPDLLADFGLEVLHIPASQSGTCQLVGLTGEIDQAALCDIGRALRAEFVASGANMLRLESDDGSELIVYAIEVRAIVMAATNIQLTYGDA
ncbi:hypothetical protein RY831_30180 [Noviherbaspirillum sp. CPCC 100848]|uniref:Uncharacterized protein n=1 Tax=Noviherbaspirillum album TaxID=3080276 RepID=A0ABU6JJF8_9BURK|nr:hypothetical protein [Noviherbaspirillum sp. CPCC 100848]MEC4723415.1 hypothetical protein [Noviherbaspirillum sp. CPCC 100848]